MSPDITSPGNERIKWLVRLRTDRQMRDSEGVFLVEGERLYQRAVEAGLYPVVTFVAPDSDTGAIGETVTASRPALDRASYRQQSQEVIGVFPQMGTALSALAVPDDPLLLVAEAVEKPGNLGAMLRTADAAGASALIAVGAAVDAHNPNVVRASTGALFTTPLAITEWDELAPWLEERPLDVVAASPGGHATLWETDLSGALALVVGAEDVGLSPRALEVADRVTQIPHKGSTSDSLNVSVAAAILLYEARRQRTAKLG